MADAPAPSGGGWGALEIILALVLAVGLISTITGHPITPVFKSEGGTVQQGTVNNASATSCSITVTSPAKKQSVDTDVLIAGSVHVCDDGSIPDTVYAQVFDSKGSMLSSYTPISTNVQGSTASFSTTVPLSGTARSTSAYVLINGPLNTDGKTVSVKVPITLLAHDTITTTSVVNTTSTTTQVKTTTPTKTSGSYNTTF